MNSYVARLGLEFDPFTPGANGANFFAGGGRQALLTSLIQKASHGGSLLSVYGKLGSGKSTLAEALVRDLHKDAVAVAVQATLFMSPVRFLEEIIDSLQLDARAEDDKATLDCIATFSNDLALDARSLVLVIDDAHELSSEVYQLLSRLLRRSAGAGLAVVLFGEPQLASLLERSLNPATLAHLASFTMPVFSSEDSIEYTRFKLAEAGFTKPLPLTGGELGALHNTAAGNPGTLNEQLRGALTRATTLDDEVKFRPASILTLGSNYWIAASALALVLIIVLLFQGGDPELPASSSERVQIPLAVRERSEPAVQQSDRVEATSDRVTSSTQQTSDTRPVRPQAPAPEPSPAVPEPVSGESPIRAAAAAPSTFEQVLLAYDPSSYTVQIMGSRSVEKIREFLSGQPGLQASGYFETRFQGQPWYVVVSGHYPQREQAQSAIAALPAVVRDLQPWVRSVADIQSSIRSLHPAR